MAVSRPYVAECQEACSTLDPRRCLLTAVKFIVAADAAVVWRVWLMVVIVDSEHNHGGATGDNEAGAHNQS
jgi:hypothetical protein